MDQTHEANHSHARMALQRRSHGDGLRAEMLRSRRRGNLQRYEIGVVMPMRMDFWGGRGEWQVGSYSARESSHDRDKRTQPGQFEDRTGLSSLSQWLRS